MSLPVEHDGIVVRHAPERHRYELVDGEDVIGHTDYRELEPHGTITHRDFVHTEVDDAYGGRGLASVLVQLALDDVRAAGLRIVPHCPYVAGWIRKHEGRFDDLVDWPA
ncbi:GNAT family N-acetyltransferase [Cytobacillus oceanisediminis]